MRLCRVIFTLSVSDASRLYVSKYRKISIAGCYKNNRVPANQKECCYMISNSMTECI